MFVSVVVVIGSAGILVIGLQNLCERILGRRFDRDYAQQVVTANRLEYPAVPWAVKEFGAHVDLTGFVTVLKCDFLLLTYLLRYASNIDQQFSFQDRALLLYFRVLLAALWVRRQFRLDGNSTLFKMTTVLHYFANVVGKRVDWLECGNLAALYYLRVWAPSPLAGITYEFLGATAKGKSLRRRARSQNTESTEACA